MFVFLRLIYHNPRDLRVLESLQFVNLIRSLKLQAPIQYWNPLKCQEPLFLLVVRPVNGTN